MLADLVQRIFQGGPSAREAARELIEHLDGLIRGLIWRMHTVSIADKDDVWQETFLSFIKAIKAGGLNGFNDPQIIGYLTQIARNRGADQGRQEAKAGKIRRKASDWYGEYHVTEYPEIQQILSRFSELEQHIYERVADGDTFRNISNDLCLSYNEVRRIYHLMAQEIIRLWETD